MIRSRGEVLRNYWKRRGYKSAIAGTPPNDAPEEGQKSVWLT
jgi:hypothetical protein